MTVPVPLNPEECASLVREAVKPDIPDEVGLVAISSAEAALGRDLSFVREHLSDASLVIVLVKKLDPLLLAQAPSGPYQEEARRVFDCLTGWSRAVVRVIEGAGYRACWPGAQKVEHQKGFAVAAGLGELGDNMLFISYRYGPGVHLETVLASIPLRDSPPVAVPGRNLCLHCGACAAACPAGAIGVLSVDRDKCRAYRREVTRGFCGICMRSCVRAVRRGKESVADAAG